MTDATNNLPEGVLRSTFLPEDTLGGTKIFLSFEKGWYVVHTNWQNLARRRDLSKAIAVYESILMGEVAVIGGAGMQEVEKRQLEWAIEQWAKAALGAHATEAYRASCDRTVKALRLELETGEPHCNCCFVPSAKCPWRIRRGDYR